MSKITIELNEADIRNLKSLSYAIFRALRCLEFHFTPFQKKRLMRLQEMWHKLDEIIYRADSSWKEEILKYMHHYGG